MTRVVVVVLLLSVWLCNPLRAATQTADASQPDDTGGGTASAEVHTPWSGWWWPASDTVGPTLFAPGSPLDKYDRYVSMVTGESPGTRAWERQEVNFPGSGWAGHCNGFAAAALLEPEPTEPVIIFDIPFSVADQKGLLVDYHFGDAAAWSYGEDGQLDPADFHRMLLNWVQAVGKGFVLTYDMGNGEVWSYPLYRFESQWSADPQSPEVWDVSTTVWMADMNVAPNFVGSKPYPGPAGKTFEYTLEGDPKKPSSGAWTGASRSGRFAHPGRIWYPDASVRNPDRDLVSPGLDRQTVANILAGSDGSDAVITPVVSATSTPVATPTMTPVATPTATPVATATQVAAASATPVPTPSATRVATASATPVATPTGAPSAATRTATPETTRTATPVATPRS